MNIGRALLGKYEVRPETNRILFDFYLSNAALGLRHHKVRYQLDDIEPLTLTSWAPVWLEGLDEGEHTVRVELLDENGTFARGPYNSVEKKFSVVYEDARED